MKKIISLFVLVSFFSVTHAASALRSDTIDIRKTIIDFTITDFTTHVISAKTAIDIKSLMNNVNELVFDLEGLIVDSVKINGNLAIFNYISPALKIPTLSPMNINDTALVEVYYHGVPVGDALWGGFYFVGNYGFQLGVGFNAQPHSYGRTWLPCFDNFVERSSYEFFITTEDTKAAICNGLLIDSTTNTVNNTKQWHWKLDEQIPSYLVCLAVCNYVFVKKVLTGNAGNIEALITCESIDTNKVNGSFANLQKSFTMLEDHFGTYSWPRVGYSLVPFNGGAMEHATNISIGKGFIDGSLTYETLIAHELSHHWWGDLVTCSTAGDMWLNEGFASYCEALHTEQVYGYPDYLTAIRANHYDVLYNTHRDDDGYRSVANMDSLHTYGPTVYNKGKDVIHTMRSYMGDALFFSTLKSFLNSHKFQSINTLQLRDYLTTQSGIDMTDYFKNWILAPGFPHFSIDSIQSVFNGSEYDVSVFLRQRKHHSTDYYDHVPLELAFYDNQMNAHNYQLEFMGRCMQFNVKLPFDPAMTVIDPNAKISDAITDEAKIIKTNGNTIFNQAKCRIITKSIVNIADSAFVRAEHNWIAPDRFKNAASFPGYVLADSRYWKIDGINLSNLKGLLMFQYDATSVNNFLDSSWVKNTEDSIRLFYRKDATEEWQFASDSLAAGSLTDKRGSMYAKEIKAGEYALGIKRSGYTDPMVTDAPSGGCGMVTTVNQTIPSKNNWCLIYPNPANTEIHIQFSAHSDKELSLQLHDALGRLILENKITLQQDLYSLDIHTLPSGIYYLTVKEKGTGKVWREKVVKE